MPERGGVSTQNQPALTFIQVRQHQREPLRQRRLSNLLRRRGAWHDHRRRSNIVVIHRRIPGRGLAGPDTERAARHLLLHLRTSDREIAAETRPGTGKWTFRSPSGLQSRRDSSLAEGQAVDPPSGPSFNAIDGLEPGNAHNPQSPRGRPQAAGPSSRRRPQGFAAHSGILQRPRRPWTGCLAGATAGTPSRPKRQHHQQLGAVTLNTDRPASERSGLASGSPPVRYRRIGPVACAFLDGDLDRNHNKAGDRMVPTEERPSASACGRKTGAESTSHGDT